MGPILSVSGAQETQAEVHGALPVHRRRNQAAEQDPSAS